MKCSRTWPPTHPILAAPGFWLLAFPWVSLVWLSALAVGHADEAHRLYQEGKFAEAQAKYLGRMAKAHSTASQHKLELGLGAAAYHGGDYEGATLAFSAALLSPRVEEQLQARFNLGNTLYQAGRKQVPDDLPGAIARLESALSQYETILRFEPDHEPARRNAAFVREQLEKLRQIQPPENEDPESDPPDPDPDSESDAPPEEHRSPPPSLDPGPSIGSPPPSHPDTLPPPPPSQEDQRDWSPEEARRILANNADEDPNAKQKPPMSFQPGDYQNW